jgi:hypothetical protein
MDILSYNFYIIHSLTGLPLSIIHNLTGFPLFFYFHVAFFDDTSANGVVPKPMALNLVKYEQSVRP